MSEPSEWGLVTSFWIDTDGYTERDRLMFCCGVEFQMVCKALDVGGRFVRTIHRENESRIRMLCGQQNRSCVIETCAVEQDPDGTWSYLKVQSAEKGTI